MFFSRLGRELARRGHAVHRINFNAGDRLYWRLPGSADYRGSLKHWPQFLEKCLSAWGITDIVLFGDWRPLHAEAIRIAARHGIAVHVFEEGYLRPDWVTLERGGVNTNSSLPRDPAWFRREAAALPAWRDGVAVAGDFATRAALDVVYHVWSFLFAWLYPRYRTHLPLHPFREYLGWTGRFLRRRRQARESNRQLDSLAAGGRPYFLFPLQLDTDSQLRLNSPHRRLAPVIEEVLTSFARHAPGEMSLVLKEHPLDPQVVDWQAMARTFASRLGIEDRVFYLRSGDIMLLTAHSRGVVTVNSTCGMLALSRGVPVMTLASPVYDIPGLTFQLGLERFWTEPSGPDPALFDAFRRVVVHRTQINGGFYCAPGTRLAVEGAALRLESAPVEPGLTVIAASRAVPPLGTALSPGEAA
ncbi:MAG TPA: capsular biosynthesis protein [Rhizomicrobium sp.]|nr:capsular biosynthesis protein [Rhizomicrobium sp.]